MIDSYSFGSIVVDGKRYTQDIIVFPGKVKEKWWRKEGHSLSLEDLEEVIEFSPEILVVGTGYFGVMKVPEEVKEALKRKGISVIVEKTKQAVETFNRLFKEGKKVVGAFHLTC